MNRQIGPLPLPARPTRHAAAAVRRLGFWGSVLLPASYLPILYGMSGTDQLLTLLGVVALNVACLIAGHRHHE